MSAVPNVIPSTTRHAEIRARALARRDGAPIERAKRPRASFVNERHLPPREPFREPGPRKFHYGNKTIQRDGYPCEVAAWWGTFGNDRECLDAIRPSEKWKTDPYYAGGTRVLFDGVPCRMGPLWKLFSPWMKRAVGKPSIPDYRRNAAQQREHSELEAQMEILFPVEAAEKHAALAAGQFIADMGWHERHPEYRNPWSVDE